MADAIVAGGKNGIVRRIPLTEEKFYVYLHSRLSTGEPFYIGKGNGKRARKRNGRTLHWRNIVKKEGGFYISFLAKNVDDEFAMLAEIEEIDLFRRRGCALINFTDGGEGAAGRICPEEVRKKLSDERKGKPLSSETMAAALAYHLGSKHSPEHIEKIAAANRGKRRTPEQRKQMSARQLGAKRSDEARANMSKAHIGKPSGRKGIPLSPQQIAKMSAARKGKPSGRLGFKASEETKRRMSEAMKGIKQSPETCAKKRSSQLARWAKIRRQRADAGELSSTGTLQDEATAIYSCSRDFFVRWIGA